MWRICGVLDLDDYSQKNFLTYSPKNVWIIEEKHHLLFELSEMLHFSGLYRHNSELIYPRNAALRKKIDIGREGWASSIKSKIVFKEDSEKSKGKERVI